MRISLSKFGTNLTSRQAGREAFAAFTPSLAEIKENEIIEIDFHGVVSFSPSWGDEFLSPLLEKYGERLLLLSTKNKSVEITIELLERISGRKFTVSEKTV
jgi:hypothetical protein